MHRLIFIPSETLSWWNESNFLFSISQCNESSVDETMLGMAQMNFLSFNLKIDYTAEWTSVSFGWITSETLVVGELSSTRYDD
jgi:hypothetical protein